MGEHNHKAARHRRKKLEKRRKQHFGDTEYVSCDAPALPEWSRIRLLDKGQSMKETVLGGTKG